MLFPTACAKRGQLACNSWQAMGYKVAVLQTAEQLPVQADLRLQTDGFPGYPAAINMLAERQASRASALVLAHDDITPDPTQHASQILHSFRTHFADLNGVMLPHGNATSGQSQGVWVGRAWAQSQATLLDPAISNRWAEAWLCSQASAHNRLWINQNIHQAHQHWSISNTARPSFWTQSVGRWLVSDTLSFLQRLASKSASSSLTPFEQKQQSCAETAWWTLSGQRHLAAHANVALENALTHCAENGWNCVAIFGAGRHTRAAGHALLNPPVEIVAVLDDNQLLSGTRMWGYQILPPNAAHSLSIDAVVISSDTHETTLAHAARSAFPASVHIVTPYSLPGAPRMDTRTTNMTSSTTGTRIPPRPASTAPGVMSVAKDFSNELARLIRDNGFTFVLETGTYDGRGSTRNFAQALSATGKPWQLHTVEINPKYAAQARNNLKDFTNITFHEGLSLARADMPEPQDTHTWIDQCAQDFPGLYVDYLPSDPVAGYHKETFNDAAKDNILSTLLAQNRFDLILLDSAGHLGYREFDLFRRQCRHTCIVALDDVDHIKHAKSVADALNDPRFTLIFRTHEKFGAAIFTFNPHAASSRVAA